MKSALYLGWIRHRREAVIEHAFRYNLFMVYLDLAEIDRFLSLTPLWSAFRWAPARFDRRDYHGPASLPLDEAVRQTVEREAGRKPGGPIRLLTHFRYFGYLFNPVSFYFCYDAADERVEFILAEITNTPWKERHSYVLVPGKTASPGSVMRFEMAKTFHVSPFLPMEQIYHWTFSEPSDRLLVHMENYEEDRCVFDATLSMSRKEITPRVLNLTLLTYPFMTAKVIVGIYWNALKLKWKGARFYPHPDPDLLQEDSPCPSPLSHNQPPSKHLPETTG
ncbi:MAG: DUF1365 domain-containing protein [Sumerlaeia bacterium]